MMRAVVWATETIGPASAFQCRIEFLLGHKPFEKLAPQTILWSWAETACKIVPFRLGFTNINAEQVSNPGQHGIDVADDDPAPAALEDALASEATDHSADSLAVGPHKCNYFFMGRRSFQNSTHIESTGIQGQSGKVRPYSLVYIMSDKSMDTFGELSIAHGKVADQSQRKRRNPPRKPTPEDPTGHHAKLALFDGGHRD